MGRMKVWLLVAAALPAWGQFHEMEIRFEGVGCASCLDSLAGRLKRIRGVEEARVDAAGGTVRVQLAAQNRIRLEKVRDTIEQDGTKATQAVVKVRGEVFREGGEWRLRVPDSGAVYGLMGEGEGAGEREIEGVVEMKAGTGVRLVIRQKLRSSQN
jgi:copper chaperone CopZ